MFACALLLAMGNSSCHKSKGNPTPADSTYTLTPDTLKVPPHFPKPVIPADNQPYKEKERLGRMLYYDTILSNDGRYCAGCHQQANGFTSMALYENAMPVLPHENLAWYSNYMWDGSQKGTLEDVMRFEVESFFNTDVSKLNNSSVYKPLFKKYFGVDNITTKEVAYALAQYLRTVVCRNSKYDRILRGEATYTPAEYAGYVVFFTEKGDCFHCHIDPVMTDNQFHNTGLDSLYPKVADQGLYNVTGSTADLGRFRTANLRNVALRPYYMHDGRFTTLLQVIDFYDTGMHKVSNLDPIMSLPYKANGLHLTDDDKTNLIAFLNTLTDSTFISDTSLSALR